MTPIAGSLLPMDVQRKLRGFMSESELLRRCRDAARLSLRGSNYSAEDRADCAASLMVECLSDCHGTPPRATDRRYSLTAFCGRAANYRRRLDNARAYDVRAAQLAEDVAAWNMAEVIDTAEPMPEPLTAEEAATLAERIAARLDCADVPNVADLLARLARGIDGPTAAAERSIAYATLKQRESRAAKAIRARYPDAADLLRAVVGEVNPRPRIDPLDGSTVWLIGYHDGSRPATTHGKTPSGREWRNLHGEWRTGTDGGSYPARPATATAAREVCTVGKRRPRKLPRAAAKLTAAEREQHAADALRRLGYALATAR